MTDTLKAIEYVVPSTLADVYTAPALTTTIISAFRLTNVSTGTRTVDAYRLISGSTKLNIIPKSLSLLTGQVYSDSDPITLGIGDKIQMAASSSLSIHCVMSGIEHVA